MSEPNKEIVEKWVAALESGEYAQGVGALQTDTGYCCLGVLCEQAVEAGVIPESVRLIEAYGYGTDKGYLGLPIEVEQWAGFNTCDPVVRVDPEVYESDEGTEFALSHLNDEALLTFAQIAQILRENFLESD